MAETTDISIHADVCLLRIRSWRAEHVRGTTAASVAGVELPSTVGTTLAGPGRVLCIGPGDWLIRRSPHERAQWQRDHFVQSAALEGLALVDVSDAYGMAELAGSSARELLAQGCGLDLHPRSFATDCCARTRFAQIPALIDCVATSRFQVYVARSHLSYLAGWLHDAAAGH